MIPGESLEGNIKSAQPTYQAGCALLSGDPERGRTSDLQIRNLSLYPLSYGIKHSYEIRLRISVEQSIAVCASSVKDFVPGQTGRVNVGLLSMYRF